MRGGQPGILLISLILVVASGDPAPLAQARRMGGIGITVFDEPDYRGRTATFKDDVADLRSFDLNDLISSFRIPRGEIWEVCVHVDYGGRCEVFSGTQPDLRKRRGWNDEISSLRRIRAGSRGSVRPPAGGRQIVLYDRTGFRGSSRSLTGPMSSLGSFGNRVQSVQIMRGRWELCDGTRWSNRCITVTDSVPDVERLGLRGVSSVRPR